ncbi:MAG: VacB/RNase II family 3'-5' exoribonuclease [Candidatus Cloacimonetes bacterium]|nr:VacB/RNase II family 3'-5' exoribonuclease [Candidatus Cloacimonadota bacterium]
MKHDVITQQLKDLLWHNSNIAMSYNEIVNTLKLTKKEKHKLSDTLSALLASHTIIKDKKKYKLAAKAPKSFTSKPTPQNPKLIEGTFDATPLSRNFSFAFVRTPDKDYFIGAEDTLNAYHNDIVAIESKLRRGKQEYGVIRKIVHRSSDKLAGDILRVKNRWTFVCSNPKIHNWFEVSDNAGAVEGDKVVLTVTNWGLPSSGKLPVGKITEILGKSGDPQVELLAVIRQYNLPLDFPDDVMDAANHLSEVVDDTEIKRRHDLRSLFTFTIDPASAKDFDDAISITATPQGWRSYVHIADVAHYLPVGGALFTEAAKRGNSFYFPKKVIPMLPERLSNHICSLRPLEDKLCMTVETEFNRKGKILSQQIYESVICSNMRLAYEEVDELFATSPDLQNINSELPPILVTSLFAARELSRLLTAKRMAAGYIFFDLPEIEYQYDNDGFVHRLTLAEETESHKLVENFMLIANEYTAEKLSLLSPISLYRIHEDPDFNKLEKLIETLSHYGVEWEMHENLNKSLQYLLASFPTPEYHKVFDRIVLRSMKKARYSTEHISHFGLALQNYTHFTSPIRRLCDLVVHHLCKIYLLKSSNQKLSTQQVKLYAHIASDQEIQADQAERDIERIYSKTFMKDKVGETFSGIVVGTTSSGVIIRLNEIPVNTMMKHTDLGNGTWDYYDKEMRYVNRSNGFYYQLMDCLKVKIIAVDDDVYVEPISGDQAPKHIFDRDKYKPSATDVKKKSNFPNRSKAIDAKSRHKKHESKQKSFTKHSKRKK